MEIIAEENVRSSDLFGFQLWNSSRTPNEIDKWVNCDNEWKKNDLNEKGAVMWKKKKCTKPLQLAPTKNRKEYVGTK